MPTMTPAAPGVGEGLELRWPALAERSPEQGADAYISKSMHASIYGAVLLFAPSPWAEFENTGPGTPSGPAIVPMVGFQNPNDFGSHNSINFNDPGSGGNGGGVVSGEQSAYVGTAFVGSLLVGGGSTGIVTPPDGETYTVSAYQNNNAFGTQLKINQTVKMVGYQNPTTGKFGSVGVRAEGITLVKKWILNDPVTDEEYVFELNPENVTYTAKNRTVKTVRTPTGRVILTYGKLNPGRISFSGWIPTLELLDALRDWVLKEYQVKLTDELGRENWYYLDNFTASRRPTKIGSWNGGAGQPITAFDYTITGVEMNGWAEGNVL